MGCFFWAGVPILLTFPRLQRWRQKEGGGEPKTRDSIFFCLLHVLASYYVSLKMKCLNKQKASGPKKEMYPKQSKKRNPLFAPNVNLPIRPKCSKIPDILLHASNFLRKKWWQEWNPNISAMGKEIATLGLPNMGLVGEWKRQNNHLRWEEGERAGESLGKRRECGWRIFLAGSVYYCTPY